MVMKRNFLIVFLCILLSLLILVGCNKKELEENASEESTPEETQPQDPPTDYSEKTFYPAEVLDQLKIYGRSLVIDKSVTCDWPASGIEFAADCKGDVILEMTATKSTYLTVYIDGVRVDDINYNYDTNKREGNTFYLDAGTHRIKVASELEEGLHTIRVLKQNMDGNTAVDALVINGELREKPADNSLLIEFVGDSITCGYADLGINKTDDVVGAETTEGTSTYAYLTAQALGADHSMVAVSGIGIYKGFLDFNMTGIYSYLCYRRNQSAEDFLPTRQADVVVVNLGTNDESRIGSNVAEFKAHVEDLIARIRNAHGEDTPIVFCYNSMKRGKIAPDYIQAVIDAKGGADAKLYSLVMTTDISTISPDTHTHNGAPGNHPNAEQHQKQAETLTEFLKNLLNQ